MNSSTPSKARGLKKIKEGQVVSNKMQNTVVVAITTKVKDPKYGKYVKKTKTFFAHDQNDSCKVGDFVKIREISPMSKNKRWAVDTVVTEASASDVSDAEA